MYKSATNAAGAMVGVALLAACQTAAIPPDNRGAVQPAVELLGGSYRKSDAHWFAVSKGALLVPGDGGGYCGTTRANVRTSGNLVCFYADGGMAHFERAVVYSDSRVLAQFVLRDPLPFRPVEPPAWPATPART